MMEVLNVSSSEFQTGSPSNIGESRLPILPMSNSRPVRRPVPSKSPALPKSPTEDSDQEHQDLLLKAYSMVAMPQSGDIHNENMEYSPQRQTRSMANFRGDNFHLPALETPPIRANGHHKRPKINAKFRNMLNGGRPRMDDADFSVNPDPVPYQPRNFMSSTVTKKYGIPKRHFDTFGGYQYSLDSKRGIILHTDRYQWDTAKALDSLSQRERLHAEMEYLETLRGVKRRREVVPHRAELDLLMGGKRVEFAERFDIQREIQKLKSLVLPGNAKDLFHGRGFQLPSNHSSIKPRRLPGPHDDVDIDEAQQRYSRYSTDHDPLVTQAKQQKSRRGNLEGHLPHINTRTSMLGADTIRRTRSSIIPKLEPPIARSYTSFPDAPERKTQPKSGRKIDLPTEEEEIKEEKVEDDSDMEIDIVDEDGKSRPNTRKTPRSPSKVATPNPLRGSELSNDIPEGEQDKLRQMFSKLDTDKDGHIQFNQLKSQLPKDFSQSQERFMKQVYDITSSSTYFGVQEFLTMSSLTTTVENLSGQAQDAYLKLDYSNLKECILKYVELYEAVDRTHRGKISIDSLQEVLSTASERDLKSEPNVWSNMLQIISPSEETQISKIEYLAHIPYFVSQERS